MILFYSGFGLYRFLFYSRFSLDRFIFYSGSSLDRILFYSGFGLDRFPCIFNRRRNFLLTSIMNCSSHYRKYALLFFSVSLKNDFQYRKRINDKLLFPTLRLL